MVGQMGVHTGGSGFGGWPGKPVAFPIPGGEVWRWRVFAGVHHLGDHFRLRADDGRNGLGSQDRSIRHRCVQRFRQEVHDHRYPGQRGAVHHHPVLFAHRRLGHQVHGGLHRAARCRHRRRRVLRWLHSAERRKLSVDVPVHRMRDPGGGAGREERH